MLNKNKDFMSFRENFMGFQQNIEKMINELSQKQKTSHKTFSEKI